MSFDLEYQYIDTPPLSVFECLHLSEKNLIISNTTYIRSLTPPVHQCTQLCQQSAQHCVVYWIPDIPGMALKYTRGSHLIQRSPVHSGPVLNNTGFYFGAEKPDEDASND